MQNHLKPAIGLAFSRRFFPVVISALILQPILFYTQLIPVVPVQAANPNINSTNGSLSSQDLTINGENSGDKFGTTVANIGDVNDDGRDDFAMAAPNSDEEVVVDGGGGPNLDPINYAAPTYLRSAFNNNYDGSIDTFEIPVGDWYDNNNNSSKNAFQPLIVANIAYRKPTPGTTITSATFDGANLTLICQAERGELVSALYYIALSEGADYPSISEVIFDFDDPTPTASGGTYLLENVNLDALISNSSCTDGNSDTASVTVNSSDKEYVIGSVAGIPQSYTPYNANGMPEGWSYVNFDGNTSNPANLATSAVGDVAVGTENLTWNLNESQDWVAVVVSIYGGLNNGQPSVELNSTFNNMNLLSASTIPYDNYVNEPSVNFDGDHNNTSYNNKAYHYYGHSFNSNDSSWEWNQNKNRPWVASGISLRPACFVSGGIATYDISNSETPNNWYSDYTWDVADIPDSLDLSTVGINFTWSTDGNPEEGSLYLISPLGTQVQLIDGSSISPYTSEPHSLLLNDFNGEDSAGTWTLRMEDTSFNGGHSTTSITIGFGGEPNPEPESCGSPSTPEMYDVQYQDIDTSFGSNSQSMEIYTGGHKRFIAMLINYATTADASITSITRGFSNFTKACSTTSNGMRAEVWYQAQPNNNSTTTQVNFSNSSYESLTMTGYSVTKVNTADSIDGFSCNSQESLLILNEPEVVNSSNDHPFNGGTDSTSFNYETAASTDTVLIFSAAYHNGFNDTYITSASYDGQPMTSICSETNNDFVAEQWYIVSPNVGDHAVDIQFSNSDMNSFLGKVVEVSGVNTDNPVVSSSCEGVPDFTGANTNINIDTDVSSSSNQLVIATAASYNAAMGITANAGVTEIINGGHDNVKVGLGYKSSDNGSTNIGWVGDVDWPWSISAVVLRPAISNGGGGGDITYGGNNAGQVYIFFGRNTSNWGSNFTLPTNASASLIGESTNDLLGYSNVVSESGPADLDTGNKSITRLGDVNGDEIDDFAISAPGFDNGNGKVYIILGKSSGWAMDMVVGTEAVASFETEQADSKLGYAIEGIGDVNGDSYADLAISAPFYDSPSKTDNGKVYIVHGKDSGWDKDVAINSAADGGIVGRISDDKLGKTLAGVGNVVSDSKADFVIGAPNASFSGTEHGTVYLIDGRSTWSPNSVVTTVADSTIHGENDNDLFGFGLAAIGDFNQDARADFAVSAPYHSQGGAEEGKVYLFLGKSGGAGWGTDVIASDESSSSIIGECDNCHAGLMLAGGSDVDADNHDDLIILSERNTSNTDREIHVIFGQSAAISQNTGINSFTDYGSNLAADINWIAAIGDINNDGYQEYVGSSSSNNSDRGRAIVVLGEAKYIDGGNEDPGPGNGEVPLNDPYLQWGKSFGSADAGEATTKIETDRYGNIYVLGTFEGTVDFDPGPGTDNYTTSNQGIYMTKYSTNGTYQWTRTWTATIETRVSTGGFAVDSTGNSYVAGVVKGTIDFDSTAGVDSRTTIGDVPSFITKYDAAGNYLQTIFIDGPVGFALYNSVSVDSQDNIYVGGYLVGTFDLDSTAGVDNITSAGSEDAFVSKYSKDGSYIWTKVVARSEVRNGATYTRVLGNNLYVMTYQETGTSDFDPSAGTLELTAIDKGETLAKYDLDGNLVWARMWQLNAFDGPVYYLIYQDLNMAPNGDLYLAGWYYDTTDFDPGPGTAIRNTSGPSNFDGYVLKLSSAGDFQWVSTINASGEQFGDVYFSVAPTSSGEVYVGGRVAGNGQFRSQNGDINFSANGRDGIVSRYDSDGNLEGVWYIDGPGNSTASRISYTSNGSEKYLAIAGAFSDTQNIDMLDGTTNVTSNGNFDIFVAKYKLIDRVKIDNLDPSLSAAAPDLGLEATQETSKLNYYLDNAPKEVEVRETGNNAILGTIDVALTTAADWGDVTGDSDAVNGRSFLHKAAGTWSAGDVIISNSFSLYIPKLPEHSAVRVCPGADSFGDLSVNCPSGYLVSEANENVEIVNIDGQDYWKVDGVNGTGGFGLTGANLVVTPSSLPTATANVITLSYLPSGNYSDDDQINVIYDSQYSGTLNSGNVTVTKTGDANFVSGATSNFTSTGFTITLDATGDLDNLNDFEITINGLTTPLNASNYAWTVSAPEGEGLSALQYIGSENQLNVIGRVDPVLTLVIRNTADTADQANVFGASGPNLCSLGNLSDTGIQSCSYRLKVTTNSPSGYIVNVQTDGNLRKGSDFIDNVVEDINNVSPGQEGYGIALQVGSATTGTVTESGIFDDNDSPLGSGTNTALYSSTGPNNPLTTDTTNTALVTHKAEAGSSTPAGLYTQMVTYTVSASF